MRKLLILIVLSLIISVFGCRKDNGTRTVIIDKRDSGAYKLGMRHGGMLLELTTEDSVQDFLLEVRARETNIRARLRNSAGEAYVEGFKDYVKAHSDSMAKVLF